MHKSDIRYTYQITDYCDQLYGDEAVFHYKNGNKWHQVSGKDFNRLSRALALGLISQGIKAGENIASIFTYNCPQWNILDAALSMIGAIHVPVYPTSSDSDYLYVLNQVECRLVFVSDQHLFNRLTNIRNNLSALERIYSVEELPGIDNISLLIDIGEQFGNEVNEVLLERIEHLNTNNTATIIYTSGSTGLPKGVMLSHTNLISSALTASQLQPLGKGRRILSFLPICHVYERAANYQFLLNGATIYYCDHLKSLMQYMRDIKPHGITVVPRVLEKVIQSLYIKNKQLGFIKSIILRWAIGFGVRYKFYRKHGYLYRLQRRLADITVFQYVRASFGGKIQYIGCGGAALNPRVESFFWAAKMNVYQGYGLTECSPLVALNYNGIESHWLGAVGLVVPDVEVKITDEGEILCKGPNVMKGYYKNKKLTKETIIDGWLRTGDLGFFIEDKYLYLNGRKKQMFKTSYGKYIVPQAIENKFANSVIIDRLIVIGEGKHCAAAIISPNFQYIKQFFRLEHLNNKQTIEQADVVKAIKSELNKVNRQLGKSEKLKKHIIVPDCWSIESGELSPTLKLRRNILLNKYKKQIFLLYKNETI